MCFCAFARFGLVWLQVIDANRGGTECQADWVELRDGGNRTAPYIPLPRRTDQLKVGVLCFSVTGRVGLRVA